MPPFRPASGVLAVVLTSLILSSGCLPAGETAPRMEDRRLVGSTSQEKTTGGGPEGKALSASIPARDAGGEPVPDLPRYPGSVRVGYSEKEAEGLAMVRAGYLTEEEPDAVRGFYRGVFRSEGWQVANVEYSGGRWHFLVLRGEREAGVEVLPHEGGSEARVEVSGPVQEAGAGGSKR